MTRFEIKVRDLQTDELLIATLDSYQDALSWLRHRPPYVEIVTVISDVSPKELSELRAAMRPYDAKERAKLEAKRAQMAEAMLRQKLADDERAREAQRVAREQARHADPRRPMKIHWSLDGGCEHVDDFDERPIPHAVEQAVLAWVKDRNGWIAERGECVGEAEVLVRPGPMAEGSDPIERVLPGGRFVPRLSAPQA